MFARRLLRNSLHLSAVLAVALLSILPTPATAAGKRAIEGVVNVNTATAEELQLLPGIGPAKVQSILAYRRAHPFRTVEELVRVKGIGRKMVRRLRAHLTVRGPTTARAIVPPAAGSAASSAADPP
jgi:competence protein ComEA